MMFLSIAMEATGLNTVECSTEAQCVPASLSVMETD